MVIGPARTRGSTYLPAPINGRLSALKFSDDHAARQLQAAIDLVPRRAFTSS
jgi:hypothetical protein